MREKLSACKSLISISNFYRLVCIVVGIASLSANSILPEKVEARKVIIANGGKPLFKVDETCPPEYLFRAIH